MPAYSFKAQFVPFIVENKGTSLCRSVDQPVSTVTGTGYHGLITSESFNAFISYWYGTTQASCVTDPVGTCSTHHTHQLITYEGKQPAIEDCYYRMLNEREIKLAMAFAKDYVVLGSGRDQVRQLGNAVTPPAMEWQVQRAIETFG